MKTKLPMRFLFSCGEIEVHYKRPLFSQMIHVGSSAEANKILKQYINLKQLDLKEFFWVILLSHANRVVGISEIGRGTAKGVATNLHEIYQLVLLTNASGIIVVHNHPSGSLKPSKSDKWITKKIQKLSILIDAILLDHLIITSESYFSFSDNHLL